MFTGECYGPDDHLGSTRMVLADDASIVEATMYTPYGVMEPVPGTSTSGLNAREKFTTKEFDEDGGSMSGVGDGLNLYYFGARYYDPVVGVWIGVDPMNEFWNAYSYTGGNPINLIDVLGLNTTFVDENDKVVENYPDWEDNGVYRLTDKGAMFLGEIASPEMPVEIGSFLKLDLDDFDFQLESASNEFDALTGLWNPIKRVDVEEVFDTDFHYRKNTYYLDDGKFYRWDEVNYIAIGIFEAGMGSSRQFANGLVQTWKSYRGHRGDYEPQNPYTHFNHWNSCRRFVNKGFDFYNSEH